MGLLRFVISGNQVVDDVRVSHTFKYLIFIPQIPVLLFDKRRI
jgi:hypothetical protein